MIKSNYNIENYDCRKSFKKSIDSIAYLEELEKSLNSFESAILLENSKDFENAFILNYRAIQLIGNALLLKMFNLKSKDKNCQFQFLFEEKVIDSKLLEKISILSLKRNNLYYNNYSNDDELDEEVYLELKEDFSKIKIFFEEVIEK